MAPTIGAIFLSAGGIRFSRSDEPRPLDFGDKPRLRGNGMPVSAVLGNLILARVSPTLEPVKAKQREEFQRGGELLRRSDLRRRHIQDQAAVDMADNDGYGHQHHQRGYAAEDEAYNS